jgi:hypothetical protein
MSRGVVADFAFKFAIFHDNHEGISEHLAGHIKGHPVFDEPVFDEPVFDEIAYRLLLVPSEFDPYQSPA